MAIAARPWSLCGKASAIIFGVLAPRSRTDSRSGMTNGRVYLSGDFQAETTFLVMTSSPAFVRQPEGNGCIERFFRMLKEQLLWVRHFATVEELRQTLLAFKRPTTGSG